MIAHERTQPAPADRSQSEAARRSAGRGTDEHAPEPLAYGYDELVKVTSLGRRTLERLVSTHQFPKPRTCGKRTLFLASEVLAWLQQLPQRGEG